MSTTIYSTETKSLIPLFPDASGYYHLIYMIVNKINNKIYIGKHTTKNPYDNYMGSGKTLKAAIKKYCSENFEKVIIDCLSTENEAYLKEAEIVTPDFIARADTYNLKCGGKGFCSYDVKGEKNHMYGKELSGENNNFYGKHHKKETIQHLSKLAKERVNNPNYVNPMQGKRHSEETKKKMSENHWDCSGKNAPFYGKHLSECTKQKLSKKAKERYSNPEYVNPNAKPVLKIDLYGNIVCEFNSIFEAGKSIGFKSPNKISRHIDSGKQYKGFFYKYKE